MTSSHRGYKIKMLLAVAWLLLGCTTSAYDDFLSSALASSVPLAGCYLLRLRACIDTMAYVQIVSDSVKTCIADLLVSGLVLHCRLHKGMHYDPSCTIVDELTSAEYTLLGGPSARAASALQLVMCKVVIGQGALCRNMLRQRTNLSVSFSLDLQ